MLPKALKSDPKSKKSPNLVTLIEMDLHKADTRHRYRGQVPLHCASGTRTVCPDAVIKSNSTFPNSWPKVTKAGFCLKVAFVKVIRKVAKYLVNLLKKICCQDLLKIAQSGHTAQ